MKSLISTANLKSLMAEMNRTARPVLVPDVGIIYVFPQTETRKRA